jgi:hypothetical protein
MKSVIVFKYLYAFVCFCYSIISFSSFDKGSLSGCMLGSFYITTEGLPVIGFKLLGSRYITDGFPVIGFK